MPCADRALNVAKAEGRDGAETSCAELDSEGVRQRAIAAALRHAIDGDGIEM